MNAYDSGIQFLRRVSLFSDLDMATVAAVAARCRSRRLAARQLLFVEGDRCRDLHILVEGQVNCYRASTEGREQILNVFDRPGDTFCIPSAFGTGANILTARTLTETRLYLIDREIFIAVARRHPSMALTLVAAVSHDTKKVIDLAESLSLKTAKVRLAKFLYERALAAGVRRGREIQLPRERLREEDIASAVGIVRVHVSRNLQGLARAGAIILDRGVIHIPDLRALERLGDGDQRSSGQDFFDPRLPGYPRPRRSASNTGPDRENSDAQRLGFAV